MKHIIKFALFEEVNPKDISFIESLDKYFTISFEFEIETEDRSNINFDFNALEDDELIDEIVEIVKLEMPLNRRSENRFVEDILKSIVDMTEDGTITNELFFDLLDSNKYKKDREREIVKFCKDIIISQILSDEDLNSRVEKAKEYLPNFYNKWKDKIDYVEDMTLDRGVEIKPQTYLNGISQAIEMINDFYSDLNSQDYWKFSERTGLHINIGVSQENIKWNPIKGLLMLNDFNEGSNTPFVFKNMTSRLNNQFCGSFLPSLKTMDRSELNNLKGSIDLHNLEGSESILNKFITDKINEIGHKNFGFNITKLENNYVEFRYVGGNITEDVLIEKLKYFCFVIYSMTNTDYKKREYLKKLYKFVDNL